jgi:hypothetical protein
MASIWPQSTERMWYFFLKKYFHKTFLFIEDKEFNRCVEIFRKSVGLN